MMSTTRRRSPLGVAYPACGQWGPIADWYSVPDAYLAIVATAYVLSFFQRFAPAGIAPDLVESFDTSAIALGALAATYFYVYTVMQIPTGILVDTLGPRRIVFLSRLVGSGTGTQITGPVT